MLNSKRIAFIAFVTISTLLGLTEAATRSIPPLYHENVDLQVGEGEVRADEVLNYRLPNHTAPISYDVHLVTNVHTGEVAFTGTVKILLLVIEETKLIVLHKRQLTVKTATIKNTENSQGPAVTLDFSNEEGALEFLNLTAKNGQSFPKDTKWELTIEYTGQLRKDNGGFYLSTYTDADNKLHYLATTQFESTNARHAFPCYDEPAKRAKFTITITHSSTHHAISNMPVDTANSKDGTTITTFKTTEDMSTYLVAFIVSDFKWSEGALDSLPQRVFSRPGTEQDQQWALLSGMLINSRLAEYYGVPFALPKQDQVAVPDFAPGAMENWGLVTYREEALLYNPSTSTIYTQTGVASIIGHEYTHQWFGDLVAIKWWTYLWLKEGFATLYAYESMDEAYPEWDVYQLFQAGDYQGALNNDASLTSRPMTHYVQKPDEISRLYDTISYAKAGSVLNMWRNALTDVVFRQGLHNYLTNKGFSSAEEWDLFAAIQTAAKELNYPLKGEVSQMMSSWTHQGSYPLLTVERNYKNNTVSITQSAFYNNPNDTSAKLWYVPINYAIQSNPDFRDTEATEIFDTKQITVDVANLTNEDWIIVNKQSTGYYRINYDERNWKLITEGLLARPYKIHPHNRAQLLHDAYRFSSSKRLSHDILLNLLSYLPSEDQYAPWATANGVLTIFIRYLSGDANYSNFKLYVAGLVNNIYEKLGVNEIPGEPHLQKYTRPIVINLACLVGVESCLKETNDKLLASINDGIEIEPNLQSLTYCNGLKQTDDPGFDHFYNRLMASDDLQHRRELISSLGCTQKENQIKKFIESSIDDTNQLRTEERTIMLSPTYSRGEVGLLACINFLKGNWQAYGDLTPGFGGVNPLDSDIRGIAQYVVNTNQETQLLELVELVKDSDKVSPNLPESVNNSINANFNWLRENRDPLMNFVNKRSGSTILTASVMSIMMTVLLLVTRLC